MSTSGITYELALALKNAGFPQSEDKYCKCSFLTAEQKDGVPVIYDCKTERVSKPTLSELIEACGVAFTELNKITHSESPQRWVAMSYSCEEYGIEEITDGYGSTPEEAVANLWLELNKNNKTK